MAKATFRIWRGDASGGDFRDYPTEVGEGMVVLDAVHAIQAEQANDMAVRWNCKAGKCGSCSAEINGMPKLMCMTRLSEIDLTQPVTIQPMQAFPKIRDLVTDVSWNFRVKKTIAPFKPRPADAGRHRATARVPQMHRMFPVPGRLSRDPGSWPDR
jgi:succinate dehydrogenase / fumarate reductase, iron-sulfur subunit